MHSIKDMPSDHVARFDEVSEEYETDLNKNLKWTGADSSYFYRAKISMIKNKIKGEPKLIIDFGCGIGILSRLLTEAFPEAQVVGFDPSSKSVEVGRERSVSFGGRVRLESDVKALPAEADLIIAAGVFHHIPRRRQRAELEMLFSHLKRGGGIFIFEHNPFSLIARLIIARSAVDKDASLVSHRSMLKMVHSAGLSRVQLEFISFFPPKLTSLVRLEPKLKRIPLGAQYFVTGERPAEP